MSLGISLPDFLYGKLSSQMLLTLTNDILDLEIESWDVNDYSDWDKIMNERCSHLEQLLAEFQSLRMVIGKKRLNKDEQQQHDHVDG